ncbi:MAG TPA: histidine kinase [Rhodocyclaceae bacterium]|nr:histidine kinase [Rhodocyclaceae bacterium]
MSPSIRHNLVATALPDFRNLGVWLRILLGANLLGLLWVLVRNSDWQLLPGEFIDIALWLEPPLFLLLPILHLLHPWLVGLPPRLGQLAVLLLSMLVVAAQHLLFSTALSGLIDVAALSRSLLWAALASAALLTYFALRNTLYSPALAEARLLALTARIRPHFLYNSLNAVLGVIRSDPRRAETALEELSDLFRVLMKENRELVLLSDEIGLARQYLELERLRLGERLRVEWQIDVCPPDTLMPPLMLQPLLENAVYYGIEPSESPATVTVNISVHGKRVRVTITNPVHTSVNASHTGMSSHGNHMALANIRERLMLFYDLEADLSVHEQDGRHTVAVELPLRRQEAM